MEWTRATTLVRLFLLDPLKAAVRIRSSVTLGFQDHLDTGDRSVTVYFGKVGDLCNCRVIYSKKVPWKLHFKYTGFLFLALMIPHDWVCSCVCVVIGVWVCILGESGTSIVWSWLCTQNLQRHSL